MTGIFKSYAKNAGETEWGNLSLTVPEDNKPFFLPLQAGYETRKFVDKNINLENNEKTLQITWSKRFIFNHSNAINLLLTLSQMFSKK